MKQIIPLMILLTIIYPVCAVNIGVSPGSFAFENLLQEGYAERTIRITTNSEIPVIATIRKSGEMAEWIELVPNNSRFNMTADSPFLLKIIATPPGDIPTGTYEGSLDLTTESLGQPGGRAGSIVRAGVQVRLQGTVTNQEVTTCNAGGFNVRNTEIGYQPDITYTITNEGNVRVQPNIEFEVWDSSQENIVYIGAFSAPTILPTVQDSFERKLPLPDLDVGQYWTTISVDQCNANSIVEFSIVEKGGIIDQGVLEKITNKVWANVAEPVEIIATFKNTGSRIVSAKLIGDIRRDGKVMEVVETDEIDVEPGQTVDITTFFIAEDPGKYVVSGQVQYNRKRTFEKGSIINVNSQEEKRERYSPLLFIYLILIISIIYMIRKISRKRKRKF